MPTTHTSSHKSAGGGHLRIGNQSNAINILAQSQTHPLKAVCELVENAIDARSRHIHIIRRKRQGRIFLEFHDDGGGVGLNEQGEPDFEYIATHICDSMKRRLKGKEKAGVHGEFGIGMLSFWSLGEQLKMASAGSDGRVWELILRQGNHRYDVRPMRGRLDTGGARIVVGPLLDTTRKIVTGEKLQRYLSAELRDRIRSTGVSIRIVDRVSRKQLDVRPREFEGERLEEISAIPTRLGDILVELYIRPESSGVDAAVAVCKDGTRVLPDLTALEELQCPPWTSGRLEGVVDFAQLNLAPGTRSGVVPDEYREEFVKGVHSLESAVLAAIEYRDQVASDHASQKILRQLQRAFLNAIRELPPEEYLFFDIPQRRPRLGQGARSGSEPADGNGAVPVQEAPEMVREESPITLPIEPGPLAAVKISPGNPRCRTDRPCKLVARASDEHGLVISEDVEYFWRIVAGSGRFSAQMGPRSSVVATSDVATSNIASGVGLVEVEVHASCRGHSATGAVQIRFVDNAPEDEGSSNQGLPTYRLERSPGSPWRSRYDSDKNEIVINSAHRDFLASKSSNAKHRRYIGKLYAKEVVLINFPHESADLVMDRLIEMLVRTEDSL